MIKQILTTKNIIRILLGIPFAILLIYSSVFFITHKERPTFLDCGVIESKSNDEVAIKHGTRTELYLNINFEKSGFKSIEVSPTTYFKNQRGERVCFNIDEKVSAWYRVRMIIGLFTLFMVAFTLGFLLICYLFQD